MESRAKDIIPIIQFLEENADFYLAPTDDTKHPELEKVKAMPIFDQLLTILPATSPQQKAFLDALKALQDGNQDPIKEVLNPPNPDRNEDAEIRAKKLIGIFLEHINGYQDETDYPIRLWRLEHPKSPNPTPAVTPTRAASPTAGSTPIVSPAPASPTPASPTPAASPAPAAPAPAAAAPAPAVPKPARAPLPNFANKAVRDKHRPTIENVKKRFGEYRKLINHYRSVANVAIASMDQQKFLEIKKICAELEYQLSIYQAYTKYKLDQAITAEKTVLGKIRYDDSKLIQTRLNNIDELLVKLDAVAKMAPAPTQRVHAFSHESEVIDIKDIEKKLKDIEKKNEFLGSAPGTTPTLEKKGVIKDLAQQTTGEFSTKARVNQLQYEKVVFVSVQQVEKGVYQSSLYSIGKLDLSMQGKLLGHRIPNDTLLAIAIKEVQNWRVGNPDPDSTMVLEGAMPKALLEAFVLYCEHRGYKYSNDTVHQITLTSIQTTDYRERLRKHPQFFVDNIDNRGLLDKGQDVAEAQKHTKRR